MMLLFLRCHIGKMIHPCSSARSKMALSSRAHSGFMEPPFRSNGTVLWLSETKNNGRGPLGPDYFSCLSTNHQRNADNSLAVELACLICSLKGACIRPEFEGDSLHSTPTAWAEASDATRAASPAAIGRTNTACSSLRCPAVSYCDHHPISSMHASVHGCRLPFDAASAAAYS